MTDTGWQDTVWPATPAFSRTIPPASWATCHWAPTTVHPLHKVSCNLNINYKITALSHLFPPASMVNLLAWNLHCAIFMLLAAASRLHQDLPPGLVLRPSLFPADRNHARQAQEDLGALSTRARPFLRSAQQHYERAESIMANAGTVMVTRRKR